MTMHIMNEEEPLEGTSPNTAEEEVTAEEEAPDSKGQAEAEPSLSEEEEAWRDKYLRLYAEFDNFRKRQCQML